MTRLTVDIDNQKSEKVILAVLKALGLDYKVETEGKSDDQQRVLNKAEKAMYNRLKSSFEEVKLYQEGKIKLKTIEEVLAELS